MKKVKVVIGIVHVNSKEFRPYFWIGNQGFDLIIGDNLEEAQFTAKMIEKALRKLNPDADFILNKYKGHYWGNENELER